MDAFQTFLQCILYLSISVRARALAIVRLRALVWRLISGNVGKPQSRARFQVEQARVLTRRGLEARWRNPLQGKPAWNFQWNAPTDSRRLGKNRLPSWTRPCFVDTLEARLWHPTRSTARARELQQDAAASPLNAFQPDWAFRRSPVETEEPKANIMPRCVLLDGRGQLLLSWESFPWKLLQAYARSLSSRRDNTLILSGSRGFWEDRPPLTLTVSWQNCHHG